MTTPTPFQIISKPGIKQDSTLFEGTEYVNGQWCRFDARGNPKKMGGYVGVTSHLSEIVRGMNSFASGGLNYVHLGSASFLTQQHVDFTGTPGSSADRTPAAGFVPNLANLWQLDFMQNKVSGASAIIAHAGQNLNDITSNVETAIYYGPATGSGHLSTSAANPVSGGILALPPFMLGFSNAGRVDISPLNDPTAATPQSTYVTPQKIVRGMRIRGQTPTAILWSLDALIIATYDAALSSGQPNPVFDFSEVATEISILSSQGPVELDSIYYWPGVDRFMMYNGIYREMPNNMNIDFFYDNLNFAQRQKAFSFKVPRWGELWFCAPLFGATECNHAVIYNTRLQTWYNTPLPDGGRSAALFARVYQRPFMCDVDPTSTGFTLWQHETGLDKVLGSQTLPIDAFYQTHEISPIMGEIGTPQDKAFRVSIVEPDFNQTGPLTCTVYGRANARLSQNVVGQFTIPQNVTLTDGSDQVAFFKTEARLLSFKFESNSPGGNFRAGRVLAHIEPTDGRITQ